MCLFSQVFDFEKEAIYNAALERSKAFFSANEKIICTVLQRHSIAKASSVFAVSNSFEARLPKHSNNFYDLAWSTGTYHSS